MGLDMYLWGRKLNVSFEDVAPQTEEGFSIRALEYELGYWRKHPNLHGFIVNTFADGVDECQKIILHEDDVEKIIAAILENRLPDTEGPFFGTSQKSQEQIDYDLSIWQAAKNWLDKDDGIRYLIYESSW